MILKKTFARPSSPSIARRLTRFAGTMRTASVQLALAALVALSMQVSRRGADRGSRGRALERGPTRAAGRADRTLSRRSADPGPDGRDLSARGCRGRALGERKSEHQRQVPRGRHGEAVLGYERPRPRGRAADAGNDERPAHLDATTSRRGSWRTSRTCSTRFNGCASPPTRPET